MRGRNLLVAMMLGLGMAACADNQTRNTLDGCSLKATGVNAPSLGQGLIYEVDPMFASGDPTLSPLSSQLDEYRSETQLRFLSGNGLLDGNYVSVTNFLQCAGDYLAFDELNQFYYGSSDPEFQEVMAYHYGTEFRHYLNEIGYLEHPDPIELTAQCRLQDNAFYVRTLSGGKIKNRVCMGASVSTFGAHYADDSVVTIHELQHSVTANHYSSTVDFNQLLFDEAGSINESVSDFIAMVMSDRESVPASIDRRRFSRWALGSFDRAYDASRGAHRCPQYDPSYPDCTGFEKDASVGFSAEQNRVSYVFPAGMGWPYGKNFTGPGYLKKVFTTFSRQEQIHNHGVFFTGALWEAYEALKFGSGGSLEKARELMVSVVIETLKNLPKPTEASRSPITYIGFIDQLVALAPVVGFSQSQLSELEGAFRARGLLDSPELGNGWAALAPVSGSVDGLLVVDHPAQLKRWISRFGYSPSLIPQGPVTGLNGKMDSGEIVMLWFNIQNLDPVTAGSIELTVSSKNENLEILGPGLNFGFISNSKAQIRYSKINGSKVVNALSSPSSDFHVPTGNSYFLTNPQFRNSPVTGIWARVSGDPNELVEIELEVRPENGPAQTLTLTDVIVP